MDTGPAIASPIHGTPSVSPLDWLRAFAYTPQKPRVPVASHRPEHLDPLANGHQLPDHNDDNLSSQGVQVQSQSQSCSRHHTGVSIPETVLVPSVSARASTVPRKRTRRSRVDHEEAHFVEIASHVSPAPVPEAHVPVETASRKHTRTMSALVRRTCDVGEGGSRTLDRAAPHKLASSRPSRRVVLDAVEIVRKKRRLQPERHNDPGINHSTSAQHPPPRVGRESRESRTSDSLGQQSFANLDDTSSCKPEVGEHLGADMESPLVLKTSKYFIRASASRTRLEREKVAVLTPPSSPVLTIPVYIESSDFEHPLCEDFHDEPLTEEIVDGGLFDDLMIMLKRLKPILIQESIRDDPWKVLIAVRLLNVTTGKAAIPVFSKIIDRWPTPQDLANAPHDELIELLRPLGLYNKRAAWLKEMSGRFIQDYHTSISPSMGISAPMPTTRSSVQSQGQIIPSSPLFDYPGVGKYAHDSLRIFCSSAGLGADDEWKRVMPEDKELVRYLRWRWAFEEGRIWYPGGVGVVGDIDVPYLVTLVDALAAHVDHTIDATGEVYMYHFYHDLCDALERSLVRSSAL